MNSLIRLSLRHRLLVLGLAIVTMVGGGIVLVRLPIDIFPPLTRPRVAVMTEAAGLAPEEVESLVTFPLEIAFNGASGVEAVRSSSGIGLSIIYVEFGWNTSVPYARQIVAERLATVTKRLPEGVTPQIAPTSSIMGQIVLIGMWSKDGTTSPMETRTLADWVIRQRILAIPGIAQVVTMGGERKQYQVLVDPEKLRAYGVTLADVENALRQTNLSAAGGYLNRGSIEYMVRGLGRVSSEGDVATTVVKSVSGRSVLVGDVARVALGAQPKRGDSSVNGYPAVVITVTKQPDADTRLLTDTIHAALDDIRPSLPEDLVLDDGIFRLRDFIDRGVSNVLDALRDGAILVAVILFLFLLNVRTTVITLTAIPLSIVITGLVFRAFGLTINVMTLGGLAVAMGELVDDAIVDIENVFRRLRDNARLPNPKPKLTVIYEASVEVRSSIVFGTILVILVFVPLFALSGMEGRLFTPLGIAYIVSILASLLVSLTVTPVLASYLLTDKSLARSHGDGLVLRILKRAATPIIQLSMSRAGLTMILASVGALVVAASIVLTSLGTDFLPPFNEGAAQVNFYLPPGASLESSNRMSQIVDRRFQQHLMSESKPNGVIRGFIRRSGRAELDEHAEGVNVTEYIVSLNPVSELSRRESLDLLRAELADVPGIEYEVEQPMGHLISHMLSGVTAQVAIKVFGDDLDVLRTKAEEIRQAIAHVEGVAPPVVEPQQLVPELRFELDREKLAHHGISVERVSRFIETAFQGEVVSTVLEGQRTFDLVVRLDEPYRSDTTQLDRLPLELPNGGLIPLAAVARVREGGGPNTIHRDNVRRRIAIRVNTTDRDLGSAVAEIKETVAKNVQLPEGYFVEYAGQFQAQQEANRTILLLSGASLAGIFLVLYTLFPSARIVLQIMIALPIAFIGGVFALYLTGQTLSVAGMVGFISLGGIAARNGILLMSHYRHLMKEEGEAFSEKMILRGSLERLAPVVMTALTAGLGLVPLVLGGHQPGREILYPVATVILGGLVTSTLGEYFVHPGVFWRLSGTDAERIARETSDPMTDRTHQ